MTTTALVEHFFRHEYGRLVATLSRRVGMQHVEAVEDAVQTALMTGLENWRGTGLPDNPTAWLFRVAYNNLMTTFRRQSSHRVLLEENADAFDRPPGTGAPFLAGEVQDDLLRMLFVCCDDAIVLESQLVFALKTLCGFGVREIALRLFTTEANVYKRLSRARTRLRETPQEGLLVERAQVSSRIGAVHKVVYLLFTEGYLSAHAETAIRQELCLEAIRLGLILAEHPDGQTPETFALVALMYLHTARIAAREDGTGGLLLLEEQDRSRWNQHHIQAGLHWLERSAVGDVFSRYHAEAGIAAEHCLAPTFAETRWHNVAESYSLLEQVSPSPVHKLNRAVAVAQWQGPDAGLAVLEGFVPPPWIAGSYQWSVVLADLNRRAGHVDEAARYRTLALASAPTPAIRTLMERRLGDPQT